MLIIIIGVVSIWLAGVGLALTFMKAAAKPEPEDTPHA